MPLKPHPTDPDKMVLVRGEYNLPKAWVGLTDEELAPIYAEYKSPRNIYVAIEAKLKEKNNG